MAHRHTFEALDKTLKDLMSIDNLAAKDKPFGGKTVHLGVDFRQILPVIPAGTRADTISASISQSYLWAACTKFVLSQNMRLNHLDAKFASWVLKVGYSDATTSEKIKETCNSGQMVVVEKQFLKLPTDKPLKQIFELTFPNHDVCATNRDFFTRKAILTPRNETVDDINTYMLSEVQGESKEYFSSDSFAKTDTDSPENDTLYAMEYLNSLEFSGLPKHKICLKLGAPIMLLRNINQKEGLCNGTRLIVTYMGERVNEGEIITGNSVGKRVLIPRIILSPNKSKHPFTLRRRQFPIRVCYAMTINKSQGQSLESVLLYLPNPVFSHGLLYVALSRVTTQQGLTIIQGENDDESVVKNIVYKEIFKGIIR